MEEQLVGKVKFEKSEEGYGIIQTGNPMVDVYYKTTDIKEVGLESLTKGQKVEFYLESGPKGPIAKSIVLQ